MLVFIITNTLNTKIKKVVAKIVIQLFKLPVDKNKLVLSRCNAKYKSIHPRQRKSHMQLTDYCISQH